jgi:hypothetical protein
MPGWRMPDWRIDAGYSFSNPQVDEKTAAALVAAGSVDAGAAARPRRPLPP